jgi:tellurite resistance protein TehA-like permease
MPLKSLRDLQPAYFALVMATEIVATACDLERMPTTARVLMVVGAGAFAVLGAITLLRILYFPRAFLNDFGDHNRGVGFFTIVAAIAVLGSNLDTMFRLFTLALTLWIAGLVLWLLFTYGILAAFIIRTDKPSLAAGMHGNWLLLVVATEAMAQLTLILLPNLRNGYAQLLFFSLALWLCGGMLYIWMISLIFYRYTFFIISPSDLLPSYWIDMGGMAIASVVGSMLIERIPGSALADLAPFIKGLTILFWAIASWWIPMLATLAVWRHVLKPVPLVYDPLYWGAVFPLGMYTVATWRMAGLTGMKFLLGIPQYSVYVALGAWSLLATAMVISMAKRLTPWLRTRME